MLNKSLKINKKGFTLLEVVVAIFIISIGVLGIIKLMPIIFSSTSVNSSRLTAAYLAQEGIEIVRNIRDTNWLENVNWQEGWAGACSSGCEVDYYCATVEKPATNNPAGHNCFSGYDASHFLKLDSDNLYNYNSGADTKFTRKVTIFEIDQNTINILVEVFWQERGKDYRFSAREKLYKWY